MHRTTREENTMSEIALIDSIREAIWHYHDDERAKGTSVDQIAENLGIQRPPLWRYMNGAGQTIRTDTIKAMLPLIGKYLSNEEIEYCKGGLADGFNVSVSLHAQGEDRIDRLAFWLRSEAAPRDREFLITAAERCGFKTEGGKE